MSIYLKNNKPTKRAAFINYRFSGLTILIINFVFFFPESLFSSKDQRRDYEHIIIFKKIYNFRNTCIHILNYYLKLHDYYDDDYYYYYYYNDDDDDDETVVIFVLLFVSNYV